MNEGGDISDALARATLEALLESESLGVALVRAPGWEHVLASPTYVRLLGAGAAVGRPLADVVPEAVVPRALLAAVVSTGKAALPTTPLVRTSVAGSPGPVHVALTFLRVRRVTPDSDGVLVLARDVSREVHERRIGELFVALANDISGERDEAASIRSSVANASAALGADAASIFLLSPDGTRLHGALVGWDWTRTSFVAEIEHWPEVARVVSTGQPTYMTAETARMDEEDWFEQRGIEAAICAPMAAHGRVLGVLFFDYRRTKAGKVDLALAKEVADRCALLVERAAARV